MNEHYFAAIDFLYHEAELLDDRATTDWLGLLTADIDYRIPTRVTRDRSSGLPEFSESSYLLVADAKELAFRVRRLNTEYAYSERAPSRTRRIVGNVRPQPGARDGELYVRNNLLLYRGRWDNPPAILAAERHDVLRYVGTDLKLARRIVYLDHTSLPMNNLSIIL